MRRSRWPLPRLAIVALAAALAVLACRRDDGPAAGSTSDPLQRLSQLLRRGAQPGELELAERAEVERLLLPLLPPAAGELAGCTWRVAYDDLPIGDFVSIDLLRGGGETAPRLMWFHLFWRGELGDAERGRYGKRLGRWPARGMDDHHLFVRVGGVELRAVAEGESYRRSERIRAVLEAFDLERLARL